MRTTHPMATQPLITLTTDFGTRDGYVGAVQGAILTICPTARLIDITHDVPPQDVALAAWTLRRAVPYFPAGTLHVAVVDPGVGTNRRAIAVQTGGATLIAPDNGLLSLVLDDLGRSDMRCRSITNPDVMRQDPATSFDGRDLFGPAAAWLARGIPFDALGPEVHDLVELPTFDVHRLNDGHLHGAVVTVDHFGNLVTNIPKTDVNRAQTWALTFDNHPPIHGLYANFEDAPDQTPVLLVGDSGFVEIAIRMGSAQQHLALGRGATFQLEVQG